MTNRKDGIRAANKDEDNDLASMRIESAFAAAKVIVDRYRTKGLTKISCDPSVLISVNPVNVQNVHQDVVDHVHSAVVDDKASRDSDHQHVLSRCESAKEAIVSGRETKQIIIVTGESNSGKTTLCASLIDALLLSDSDSHDHSHMTYDHVTRGQEIKKQGSLLGIFASASTVLNTSSTRLVSKTTMSLDAKGNVSRIHYDLACVELTRVVVPRTGQTNFFPLEALGRYLIAHTTRSQSGGSDDDSDTLKIPRKWLSPPSDRPWTFRILADSHSTATGGRALPSWGAIRQQLGDIGLSRDDTDALQARLVTVLVLGNVDSEEGLVEIIEDILEWWGNSDTKARQGFRDLKAKLELHQVEGLWEWFRDGMCMSIYGMCLRKLVRYINDKNADLMMPGDVRPGVGSIVVLDTPGMECFQENLLDQMLFNSMNSILQAMLLDQLSFISLPDPESRTSSSFEIFSSGLLSSLTECSALDGCVPLLSLAEKHPNHFRIDPNDPLSLDVYHDNRWIRYQTELVPQHNWGGPGGDMRDVIGGIANVGDKDWLIYRRACSPNASSSPEPGARVVTELGPVKSKVRYGQSLSKVVEKYENRLIKDISDPHTGVSWIYCFSLNPNRQDQDLSKDAKARGRGIDEQDLRIKLDSSGLISVIRHINEKWPVKMNLRRFIDSSKDWMPSDMNRSNEDRVGGEEQSSTSRLERFLDRLTGSAQRSTLAPQPKSDDVDAQSDRHKQHYRIRAHGTSAQIYLDAHLGGLVQKLQAVSTAQAEVVERKTKNPFRTVRASATDMSTAASSGTEGVLGGGFGGMRVAADAMQRAEEVANGKERSMVKEREKTISSFESEVGKLKLNIEAKKQDIKAKDEELKAKDAELKVLNNETKRMEKQVKEMETEIETLNNKVKQLQGAMAKERKDKEDIRERLEKQHKDMATLLAAKMEEQAKTMENERKRWEHQSKGKNDKIKELHGQLDKWVSVYLKTMAHIPPKSSLSVSQANATKHDNVGAGAGGAGGNEIGDPLLATVASYINNALASFDACSQDDDVDYGPAFDKAFDSLLETVRVIAEDKDSLAIDRLLPLVNLLDLLIDLVASETASNVSESEEHKNNQDVNSTGGEDIENSVEYRLKACRRQLFLVIPDRLSSQLSRAVDGTRSVTPRIIVPALDAALMACAFLRRRVTKSTGDEYNQLLNVMAAWVNDLVVTARLGLPNPQDSEGGSETRSAYTSDMSGIDWKATSMPDVVDWYTSLFRVRGEGENVTK